jgi:hypothetical protein
MRLIQGLVTMVLGLGCSSDLHQTGRQRKPFIDFTLAPCWCLDDLKICNVPQWTRADVFLVGEKVAFVTVCADVSGHGFQVGAEVFASDARILHPMPPSSTLCSHNP